MQTGHRNILIDIMNEAWAGHGLPQPLTPDTIHRAIEIAQQTTSNGRRLLVGASTVGGDNLPQEKWAMQEDLSMPHGNGCQPEQLAAKLRSFKASDIFRQRPRPVLVNEDSIFIENLTAAVAAGCSWGFYCQGFGSGYSDRFDWSAQPREKHYEELSGFQTMPVNWGINTERKKTFFDKVAEITGSAE